MHAELAAEWLRLGELAFRRHEKVGGLFKCAHRLLATRSTHPDIRWLAVIKDWLLVPFTLWPVDFAGLGSHICQQVQSGRRLAPQMVFLLEQLQAFPSPEAQAAVSKYELLVQQGSYEPLIRAQAKFSSQEKGVLNNRQLHGDWKAMKDIFHVEKFRDRKGIIRRRMAQERNFRTDWEFRRNTERTRFQTAFDAFCHRWQLYGMEGDKPLLLKLSVNPTAHGLMIVIPAYWSLDPKRDLNWREINKLHKARGAMRQGPKMSPGRLERRQQAARAYRAAQKAKRLKLRGDKRYDYIARYIPLPLETDPRIIRRLVREGRER